MDALVRLSDGAPAAALLLAAIVAFSALGLFAWPALIARNLLRPHGLTQRGDYHTLVTSAFIHADVAHLLLNGFTLWAFGSASSAASARRRSCCCTRSAC